jgi:hypothetical protein
MSKDLMIGLDETTSTMYAMGEVLASLFNTSLKYNNSVGVDKNELLTDMYITLNNTVVKWANNISVQIRLLHEHFVQFFKFAFHEISSFKDILRVRNLVCSEYFKTRGSLDARKEKLFVTGDLPHWGLPVNMDIDKSQLIANKELAQRLMLPKETAIVNDMRDFAAYFSNLMVDECNRGLSDKCIRYAKNFTEFADKIANSITEVLFKRLWHLGKALWGSECVFYKTFKKG